MKPFLKWAGSKRALLPELLKRVPASFNTYHEPFAGGGALFFALEPKYAMLSDVNEWLMRTYAAVREQPHRVVALTTSLLEQHSPDHYYAVRGRSAQPCTMAESAAMFIYLNKTGFNGLFRVNQSGRFNVPLGKFSCPPTLDEENLLACASALAGKTIMHEDFRTVEARAHSGDLVYFDSPYVPVSKTANFTGYTKDGFGPADQRDLRDLALRLKRRGVHVILSNAGTEAVAQLYADGFDVREVQARRAINSKGSARGPVKEYVIT